MNPSVYLYKHSPEGVELYLGEVSTVFGLSLFPESTPIRVTDFVATSYKGFGFATQKDLPELNSVSDIKSFIEREGEIVMIDFEVSMKGIGVLRTHDDGECNFKHLSKEIALQALQKVLPPEYSSLVIDCLLKNQNQYISCDNLGRIHIFSSFDEYLKKSSATSGDASARGIR